VTSAIPEVRVEVRPRSPFALPRHGGLDGLTRVRGGVVHRLVHIDGCPVVVRVAPTAPDRVLFGGASADRSAGFEAIARVRRALGVDLDCSDFYQRFRFDPLIGRAVRRFPGLRVFGRPDPFEALAWAICEQLIESERAAEIQRSLVFRLGRRCQVSGLRDSPAAHVLAAQAPALFESFGLSGLRSITLLRTAREVASGRVDLYGSSGEERGWHRLRAIPGIGSWTVQKLALEGQGRMDQIPAGDLAYVKLVGRILGGGDPRARATEEEVQEFFAPYAPWAGLAGAYALRSSKATVSHLALVSAAASSSSVA